MKSFILLIFTSLVFFVGCSSYPTTKKEIIIYDVDFSKYSEKGFLFTTETYTAGEYDAIGLVECQVKPGVRTNKNANVIFDRYSPSEGLDSLYAFAVRKGADAIMNFKIDWRILNVYGVSEVYPSFSGFAIKRVKE